MGGIGVLLLLIGLGLVVASSSADVLLVGIAVMVFGCILTGASVGGGKSSSSGSASQGETRQNAGGAASEASAPTNAEHGSAAALTCPCCGRVAEPGQIFCGICGERLVASGGDGVVGEPPPPAETVCLKCGHRQTSSKPFCEECGERL